MGFKKFIPLYPNSTYPTYPGRGIWAETSLSPANCPPILKKCLVQAIPYCIPIACKSDSRYHADLPRGGQYFQDDYSQLGQRMSSVSTVEKKADWLGIFCSIGCAIHCASTPILVSLLPTVSTIQWLADPLFHQSVAVVCSYLVLKSIVPGFQIHRDRRVATLAMLGVGLLLVAAFVLPDACCSGLRTASTEGLVLHPISMSTSDGFTEPNDDVIAANYEAWGQTLLSHHQLVTWVGVQPANRLIHLHPILAPLGGVLLVLAHVLNIRLVCCSSRRCSSES